MTDGLFNMPFGLNVRVPTRTLQEAQKTLENQISGLWTPLFDYLEKNEAVFNGDVVEQINQYNRQAYNLGAIMREVSEKPAFDMKF
ncbi:hypothetical protein IJE86_11385 [bacterium]|nr:hypothetical protein [bacterium]